MATVLKVTRISDEKDFAMKIFGKNTLLKFLVRQIQAILSDPKHRVKKMEKIMWNRLKK